MNKPLAVIDRRFFLIAIIAGGLSVLLGAFAAHGLKSLVSERMLEVFQTAVRYQMWHSLALLMLCLSTNALGASDWLRRAKFTMVVGVVLFSGSLYLLVLTGIKALGMVTPIGGVLLIAAWLFAALAVVSNGSRQT